MDRPDPYSEATLELLRYLIDKINAQDSGGRSATPTGPAGGGLNGTYPNPIVPPQTLAVLPEPLAIYDADFGITYVQGPSVATGTAPPAITFTGTPSPLYVPLSLEIDIQTTGALGISTFAWKLNGAVQGGNIPTAATYLLGFTNITVNFPAGTYTNDNVFKSVLVVSEWDDQTGNGNNLLQATAALRPVYDVFGGPNGTPAVTGSGTMEMQASFVDSQPTEVYVLVKYAAPGTSGTVIDGTTVNSMRIYRNTAVNQWSIFSGGANGDTSGQVLTNWNVLSAVFNGAASFIWANGAAPFPKAIGVTAPGGLTVFAAGNGADKAAASIRMIVIYAKPLTPSQRAQINAYFNLITQNSNTLVFDGNSFLITEVNTLPLTTFEALNSFGGNFINNGQGGETTPVMTSLAPTNTDPSYGLKRGLGNVVVGVEGTNDIYYGATAAQAYANMQAFCRARRAIGWKVVITTILDRSGPGTPANFTVTRNAYNALIRAGWTTFADALADWASDLNMGPDGAESNLTYFQSDGTHPNVLGCQTLAGYVVTAIQSLGFT